MEASTFADHRPSGEGGPMNEMADWPGTRFRAMGSEFGLWLDADQHVAERAFSRAVAMIDELEQRMSRFLPESELNHLNGSSGRPVIVSPGLYEAIHLAVEMARQTEGFFDPTLLEDLNRVGYDRTLDQMEVDGRAVPAPPRGRVRRGWERITFVPESMTITLPAGVKVDLGGIGKGYTAQKIAEFLGQMGPCLVDAGGDIVAGEAPRGWDGWPVAVEAPFQGLDSPERDILGLWLHDAALTTSGVDRRHWMRGGQVYHHLIDPLTGIPSSSGLITVSVWHKDGPTAEALATAALVAGVSEGIGLIETAGAGGLLVTDTGQYHLAGTLKENPLWQVPVIGVQKKSGVTYYGY